MIRVICYKIPPLKNNNYIVFDDESREAALIDCSGLEPDMLKQIQVKKLNLKYILLTHGHFDHILGINDWLKKKKVPIYLDPKDHYLLYEVNQWLTMLNMGSAPDPDADCVLNIRSDLTLGKYNIQPIETPGHTPGGLSFLIGDCLFSGDTLFRHTYGRTDLPGASFKQLKASLKTLMTLPGGVRVFPGHGIPTTIQEERDFLTQNLG